MIEMLSGKKTFAVIRAVYENRNSPEDFVRELDFVLEKNVNVVIIEPDDLGEVTWRWIRAGNWLHKTAVLSGLAAMAGTCLAVYFEGRNPGRLSSLAVMPLSTGVRLLPGIFFGLMSVSSASLYTLFWQWDPCSKYQVAKSLSALPPRIAAAAMNLDNGSPLASASSYAASPAASIDARLSSGEEVDVSVPGSTTPLPQPQSNDGRGSSESRQNHPHHCPSCGHHHQQGDESGSSIRPVVLVRRDDFYRKLVHNSVSLTAAVCVCLALLRLRPSRFGAGSLP
nr:unnamed protein product [Spirometra erinaceieuropaei]